MNPDYTALKARIKECFGTYRAFAAALGISERTLRRWLNNKTPMPIWALSGMVKLLEIPDKEVDFFFFDRYPELPQKLEANIGRLDGDFFDLFMRYAICLNSMQINHGADIMQADDRLQAALKSGATLVEIVKHTEALELALGINRVMAIGA